MKNYIILHGSFSSNQEHWFPWLKTQLEERQEKVDSPSMPVGLGKQNFENWAAELDKLAVNEDTIIIAHSIAPVFVCKYLLDRKLHIKKLISVCGFNNFAGIDETYDGVNTPMFIDELSLAKNQIDQVCCFYSDNDPYVPYELEKRFAEALGAKQIIIPGAGHLNTDTGYTSFEELLAEI